MKVIMLVTVGDLLKGGEYSLEENKAKSLVVKGLAQAVTDIHPTEYQAYKHKSEWRTE